MKKKSILKVLTATLCLTMMMSTVAFAAMDTNSGAGSKNEQAIKVEETQLTGAYIPGGGTITEISTEKDSYTIMVSNDQGGMIFATTANTLVVDQKSGKIISVKDLEKGMELVAIYPANSPMGLSLPPYCASAIGFVVADESSSVNVSAFDKEFVNADNTLKLNISEKTQIIDTKGTKIKYTADDVKGRDCVVLYSVATRSIPAQTTPEMIILLEESEVKGDAPADKEEAPVTKEDKYTELRAGAEAKGYKVEWTSSKKPLVLIKNDMKIELTNGSKDFTFTHMTRDIKALDRMEALSMSVMLEDGKTMVPTSFIDALE